MGEPRSEAQATVLLAEEDDMLREQLAGSLLEGGYRVVEVSDGLELLDYLELTELFPGRLAPPAVVVCDADLPGRGGVATCRLLALHGRAPRFIILAPKGNEELKEEALRAGAIHVLSKPVMEDDLRDAVDLCCAPKRLLQRLAADLS